MRRTRAQPDYYGTLGLTPSATPDEIRRAYRRLALQWHPDRNPGRRDAEARFKEISEAYAVLIDPAKRAAYDRSRREGTASAGTYRREELFRDLFANAEASSVFEELARELERFGVRADRQDFYRALFGGRAVVVGAVFVISPLSPLLALWKLARTALGGTEARTPVQAREPAAPLPWAGGFARVLRTAGRWLLGLPAPITEADVTYPLRLTRREAQEGTRKRLTLERADGHDEVVVTIPPGTRPGTKLRLRGKGRRLPDGRVGDAYLAVEVLD
jgi:DnaJ-class molecular chaperone